MLLLVAAAPAAENDVQLASVHAVIGNLKTNEVLHEKNAELAVPIASITKLMTAMVVLDGGQPLDEWLPMLGWERKSDKNAYSRIRLTSESTRAQLLKIALMSSETSPPTTWPAIIPAALTPSSMP